MNLSIYNNALKNQAIRQNSVDKTPKEFNILNTSTQKTFMKNIGGTIKTLRQEKNVTLPALAELAGLSKGLLSQIENTPDANPSLSTLYKIAEALDEPLSAILETEQVQLKRVIPAEPPVWQKGLILHLKEKGRSPDQNILDALYMLRNRKGAKKNDVDDWVFLYSSIENSFKK